MSEALESTDLTDAEYLNKLIFGEDSKKCKTPFFTKRSFVLS